MTTSIAIAVIESSQSGEARRKAVALASQLGFDETKQGSIGIIVTELANNLVRHAREGVLLLRPLQSEGMSGIEILALDRGPGMNNPETYLRDGFSTAGTAGNGLGAIQRLSDLFEIYSVVDEGTSILCQLWRNGSPEPVEGLKLGVVCLPKLGEEVSGDAWATQAVGGSSGSDRHLLLVADGLGHGPLAAEASQEAVRIFHANPQHSPPQILEVAHTALRSTRGAAVAIADINLREQTVEYAGVGNIAARLCTSDRTTNMISHNGTIGHEVRKIQPFTYAWLNGGVFIMHSDGLGTQWRLDRYLGLLYRHPSLIAGILYRDFNRGRDDVTVLVVREVQQP